MILLVLALLLAVGLVQAGLGHYSLCLQNVTDKFFVVYSSDIGHGYVWEEYGAACQHFGLLTANVSQPELGQLSALLNTCMNTTSAAGFINAYAAVPGPFGCWVLAGGESVESDLNGCSGGFVVPAVCQYAPPATTTSRTTTAHVTWTKSLVSTDVLDTTTTLSSTSWLIVDETVTVSTVTQHQRPNYRPYAQQHHHSRPHYKSGNDGQPKRLEATRDVWVACSTSFNGFFFVKNTNRGPDDTYEMACAAVGYPVANLTTAILQNIAPLFQSCQVDVATFGILGD